MDLVKKNRRATTRPPVCFYTNVKGVQGTRPLPAGGIFCLSL
jgi:hypothetical protein